MIAWRARVIRIVFCEVMRLKEKLIQDFSVFNVHLEPTVHRIYLPSLISGGLKARAFHQLYGLLCVLRVIVVLLKKRTFQNTMVVRVTALANCVDTVMRATLKHFTQQSVNHRINAKIIGSGQWLYFMYRSWHCT